MSNIKYSPVKVNLSVSIYSSDLLNWTLLAENGSSENRKWRLIYFNGGKKTLILADSKCYLLSSWYTKRIVIYVYIFQTLHIPTVWKLTLVTHNIFVLCCLQRKEYSCWIFHWQVGKSKPREGLIQKDCSKQEYSQFW